MRGYTIGIGRRVVPDSNLVLAFSTSSGRGRGGPIPTIPTFEFAVNKAPDHPEPPELTPPDPTRPSQPGLGHGRGKPLSSDPTLPAYSSFISSLNTAKPGLSRGRGDSGLHPGSMPAPPRTETSTPSPIPPPRVNVPLPEGLAGMPSAGRGKPLNPAQVPPPRVNVERPLPEGLAGMPSAGHGKQLNPAPVPTPMINVERPLTEGLAGMPSVGREKQLNSAPVPPSRINVERPLPEGLAGVPSAGRGKPLKPSATAGQAKEENRHARFKPRPAPQPRISGEEGPRRATGMIGAREDRGRPEGRGRGRGKAEGKEWEKRKGRGRGRGRREQVEEEEEEFEKEKWAMDPTDDAEAEKFAQRMGAEKMSRIEEAFQEAADKILPSPDKEDFIDALHTNSMIEFEPEYFMGEFNHNPDIDEKPPMPLQDFLEKIKPFMVAYTGMQTQEEWEEAMEEVMKDAPMLKEIVDYYSGPDRITAKKQQEELDKLAKSVSARTPAALRQFTNRAVLSLQSNPGWKYDKKYQFMDKLVQEVQEFK